MVAQEASARQEILERVRHKHQRREILIQNISNKLAVNRDFVTVILQQLVTEGVVRTDNVDGVEMVTLVPKQ